MSWGIKGTEQVTVIEGGPAGEDEYGNVILETLEKIYDGCLVELGGSSITQEIFREKSDIEIVVHFPHNTQIFKYDILIVRGERYSIAAEPLNWIGMAGSPIKPMVLVGAKRVNG